MPISPDSKQPPVKRPPEITVDLDYPHPFPLALPQPSRTAVARRSAAIGRLTARNFGPLLARKAARRPLAPDAWARPLRLTFEELGATFMKFGQLIGSAPGVFGEPVADEFRSCLDTGAPVPFDQVRAVIEHTLGGPMSDTFAEVEVEPIGRASIAVVHRARLLDGTVVAIKILRPGIEEAVAIDLGLMVPMVELVTKLQGPGHASRMRQALDGFGLQVAEELDLRNESRAMRHYRSLLAEVDLPLVTVPVTYPELSGPRMLVMEFLDGVPIDDLARIEEFGHDARPLVEEIVRAWFLTAIRWGTFHGDVHAGNLLMLRDGRLGIIDWGIVGRLDPETHKFFVRIIQAALGDDAAWPDIAAHLLLQFGPAVRETLGLDDDQLAGFIRAQIEPLLTLPFGQVSLGTLLTVVDEQVNEAHGRVTGSRSVFSIASRWRKRQQLQAEIEAHGGMGSDFDRGTFLLSKQLLYFERYGKMFLSDVSLLQDREFFAALVGEPTS